MKYKILNTIGPIFSAEAQAILNSCGDVDYKNISQAELLEKAGEYDVLVVGLGLTINKEVLEAATQLRVICSATTGLDHIDVEYAQQKGIEVLSLRGEEEFLDTITGTAELALGLMLDLVRRIPFAFESVKHNEWKRENFRGHSLFGKTLGIVGLGRLGKMMARYGRGLGMNVIAFDPHIAPDVFEKAQVDSVDFETLLEKSDVISIHVHLSNKTENMFNAEVLKKMKPQSYLINTARGKIVNEGDVLNALKNKIISGYATDVLADETTFGETFAGHPLVEYAMTHDNLIVVPHIGGMTEESREATDIFIAEKLKNYFVEKNKE